MSRRRVARVLLDSPVPQLDRLFDYEIPDSLAEAAIPGVRVRVPLRSAGRMIDGYIVEVDESSDSDRPLSELEEVVSPIAVLPNTLYTLARRAADRAAGSASDVLRVAVPKRMVRAEKAWLAADPPAFPQCDLDAIGRARAVLDEFPGATAAISEGNRLAIDAPPRLTSTNDGAHVGAWAHVIAASAAVTLATGRSAIIVVPDHRDRAQVTAALADFLPADAIVRDDAAQSGPARYAAYLRVLAKAPCVVVGTRSTVYSPAARTGLVIIWDDGDPLLSEPLSPGVHARDAALLRQEIEGSALLFIGHTRTSDVERLVAVGWVREIAARRRQSPRVVLAAANDGDGRGARIPSSAYRAAREALALGPVLVQVSRPGYAPTLVCSDCRKPARCRHCAGPLHARRPKAAPECTWCGRTANNWTCANCDSDRLRMASAGSERTADELGRAFPGVRVVVADGEHPVTHLDDRPALVIATRGAEPIAAGGYRAILLLDGERMLLAEDLRIGESALRWWSNAAALAAPGASVHLVGVVGPVARALATWTQPAYARAELEDRGPLRMPPTVRVASLEGELAAVTDALQSLHDTVPAVDSPAVLGPVPIESEDGPRVRALVRFDYNLGSAVTAALRAAVIAAAMRARKPRGPRAPRVRNTLKVRVDVPDLQL
ncbi:primosomal protein N' (replication factor Y) [Microbacterium halimionae]|uniref:Probable replication restart protein PriA n=1 Tax=Microbacterium halimionae TaxID=1526413 RepID=A0A7W3JNT8_9MICO|nr:primosomal protein N' [Microbacterium halimionae]MBA8816138.1 primosomal protein N' (replication factor Y) [Microbacterium halimionae]NII96340.1 primosomal protein N' (replication factor Y) [Microbacterium halimionae]